VSGLAISRQAGTEGAPAPSGPTRTPFPFRHPKCIGKYLQYAPTGNCYAFGSSAKPPPETGAAVETQILHERQK